MTDSPFPRDRWGRPVLPNPLPDGKPRFHFRPSSIGGMIADRYNLEKWGRRMVLAGAAARPDLLAKADSLDNDADKRALNAVAEECIEAAKASAGANTGTALHRYTEDIDRGVDVTPLAPFVSDLEAYRRALDTHGLEVDPDLVEVPVIWPDKITAGSVDRFVGHGGDLKAYDLKTGRHNPADYSTIEYAAQLACYANATHRWHTDTETVSELPEINTEVGLILWLPAGDGHAELIEVDLEYGARMVDLAIEVYWSRKDKTKARVVSTPEPVAEPLEPLTEPAKPDLEPVEAPRLTLVKASTVAKAAGLAGTPTRTDRARRAIATLVESGAYTDDDLDDRWPPIPKLDDVDELLDSDLDILGRFVVALHAEAGLDRAPDADVMVARLVALPLDLSERVTDQAADLDPPPANLRTGRATVGDLERVDVLVTVAENEAGARVETVLEVLQLLDEPAAVVQWATEQRAEPVKGTTLVDLLTLTALEVERVTAIGDHLFTGHGLDDADNLELLLDVAGSRSDALKAGKFLARRHDLTVPKSAADIAADTTLTALVIQQTEKSKTE